MPLYDFVCRRCGGRSEQLCGSLEAAKGATMACAEPDCDGACGKAAVDADGPTYQMTIERFLEVRRSHLPTFRPPPLTHTKSGAGIRRYPGKD